MKLLVDTNIVLDFLLEREPFFQQSKLLFEATKDKRIIIYVTPITVANLFEIAKLHTQDLERAKEVTAITLATLEICLLDHAVLQLASFELALASPTPDFEDAVKIACVLSQGLDAIVARDPKFSHPSVAALSVNDVLERISIPD